MFIYRYNKIWLCIDLQHRIFYITASPDSTTISFDNVEIVTGDVSPCESAEENIGMISKKFNFLKYLESKKHLFRTVVRTYFFTDNGLQQGSGIAKLVAYLPTVSKIRGSNLGAY